MSKRRNGSYRNSTKKPVNSSTVEHAELFSNQDKATAKADETLDSKTSGDFSSSDKKKVKILVSYHKKDALLKDEILTPINAGRAVAIANNNKDLDWLTENCIGDNTGENISEKNLYYNEMTSIYWAWKNYDKLGDPDYIGHFHYRRHLYFKDTDKSLYELGNLDETYLEKKIGYSYEKIQEQCSKFELIVPKKQWRASAYEHFRRNFDIKELDDAVSIMKEHYPEYSSSADEYLAQKGLFFCNIFIMKKELFMEYCDFVFSIMGEFEKFNDMTGKRMYISEWLTGIFIFHKIKNGITYIELPTAVAEANVTIPVAFAADNNYAMQMCVSMYSMLKNAKETTFYDIRCLIADNFSENNKKKIISLTEEFPNCKIVFYNFESKCFDNVIIKTSHLSVASFYRLVMAELFNDLDKILYLDVDLIVCQDLSVMYRYALDENYIAGVKSPGYHFPETSRIEKLKELGIPDIEQYVNAGVLLMNLKLMRQDNMCDVFKKLALNNYRSEDQDVLNVACYNRIKHIPFRFNTQTKYFDDRNNEYYKLEKVIPADEIEDAQKRPVILHYANKIKPWQEYSVYKADVWLSYAKASPYANQVHNLKAEKQYLALKKKEQISKFISKLDPNKQLGYIPDNFSKHKKQNFDLSVIIPCYNVSDFINETLSSVMMQTATMPKIEVICIDDGSTDGTLPILCQWAEEFDNIVVLVQSNKGSGPARNLGINASRGEFIAFMDGDDCYPSNTTLENLYFSAKNNKADICGGSWSSNCNGKINTKYCAPLEGYTFSKREIINYQDYQFEYGYQRFVYSSKLIKENNISFPAYKRYQDPSFFVNAMIAAGKFMAVPEFTYQYRIQHKTINWNEEKVCDLICGLRDVLNISRTRSMSKLHYYAYLRLLSNLEIIKNQLSHCEFIIFAEFTKLVTEIDYELMSKAKEYEPANIKYRSKDALIRYITSGSDSGIPFVNVENRLYAIEAVLEKRLLENGSALEGSELLTKISDKKCIRINFKEVLSINECREKLIWNRNEKEKIIKERNQLQYELDSIRKSFSYRLAMFFTWLPRKIRKLIG